MNLVDMYSKLPQDQRNSVGQKFLQELGISKPSNMDTNNVTPQQLADLHQQAAQRDPGILQRIRAHPAMAGILGGVATYELDKHFGQSHP
jgi:hypothetical protein